MKNNKRGISLIVLIVTIIVIIILAAVVILTLSKNNPVESARKARFMEDVRSFQDELALSVSKDYVTKKENRNEKFNATSDGMKEYIPSITDEYKDKLKIVDDELMYLEDNVTENEKKWLEELGIGTTKKSTAQLIEEDPKSYYGEYVLNYTTDNTEIDKLGYKWRIFHSDGENIYLITEAYVYEKITFSDVIQNYEGSQDIINKSEARKWISWIDKYPKSTNDNIKAVAYMLDTNVWEKYAGSKAKYAIGGPTIEMFVASYNKVHEEQSQQLACNEMDENGYKIKKGNENYDYFVSNLSDDELYLLYIIRYTGTAYFMYLASPSSYENNKIMVVSPGGIKEISYMGLNKSGTSRDIPGTRPIVCLKSDVTLKKVSGGYEIE